MSQEQFLGEISRTLGRLQYQIKIENAAGFFSQNKLLETLILPVLKEVYSLPRLRNANDGKTNRAHVDLVDDAKKQAWQVTTEGHASKITKTLTGFVNDRLHRQYRRLRFFIFSPQRVAFQTKTKRQWAAICRRKLRFNPAEDIVQFDGLYRAVSNLPFAGIKAVRAIITESVVGESYVDVAALLQGQALGQVQQEKDSAKYIPDIFVETAEAKSLARNFWHPQLFLGEILDRCDRSRLPLQNAFLEKCGLPRLPILDLARGRAVTHFAELTDVAQDLEQQLARLAAAAVPLEDTRHGEEPPLSCRPERRHYYDQNAWQLRETGRHIREWAEEISESLAAIRARVFILTGKAGQGKTNFVCDFVERFATPHGVPCAYFTGLQLGRVTADLPDHVLRTLFQGKAPTFEKCAQLLSDYAASRNQPFVFVIEGLNEHARIHQFALQLEALIETALRYPHIRFFLTCRSEYFVQRFGNLERSSFRNLIRTFAPLERHFGDHERTRLLAGYFKFFGIDPERVNEDAQQLLRSDTLLLRFFCEAYGARGRPTGYVMPYIPHVYRAEIFERYLERKLAAAARAKERATTTPSLVGPDRDLLAVVRQVAGYMVTQRQFSDVPLTAIPAEMHEALYFLIGEEILLRRDPAAQDATSLGPAKDVLNFIYDEFRDFLIAKYLVQTVYPHSTADFSSFLACGGSEGTSTSEGLKRFLFYLSRRPEYAAFWDFYRQQSAYAEVFVPEVFYISPKIHNADDVQRVRQILETGGPKAVDICRALTWWGVEQYYPVLNLRILIEVIGAGDDTRYDALLRARFQARYYYGGDRTPPTEEWIKVVEEQLLPYFKPDRHAAFLDFMVLLFPLDPDGELESPTVRFFRRVAATHSDEAQAALERSLQHRLQIHRPFVWRLLGERASFLPPATSLRSLAAAELPTAAGQHATEIQRFLSRLPPV